MKTTTLPSGYVGIHRAPDEEGWEAYVVKRNGLHLLGVYATKQEAVEAREQHWRKALARKAGDRKP